MYVKCVIFSYLFSLGSCGVIIPEEWSSMLSVILGTLPPIKKGTDSRFGYGFAFGNHADFQVMYEFGPQTNTQNLTGQGFQQAVAKRQAPQIPNVKINKNRGKHLKTEGNNYLQTWAEQMKQKKKQPPPGKVPNLEDSMVELVKNKQGEYEIYQSRPGAMPVRVLEDLKRLYGQKKEEAKKLGENKRKEHVKKRTEAEVKKIMADLSEVSDVD